MESPKSTSAARAPARPPSLLYVVKQVELVVRAHLDELLRPAGVTALQYTALTVLQRRDGLSSAELARNSFVTPQAMSDLVVALERRGLISRERDAGNMRRLVISLTPAGEELLQRQAPAVASLEKRMLRGVPRQEQALLRDLLGRCRANLADTPAH